MRVSSAGKAGLLLVLSVFGCAGADVGPVVREPSTPVAVFIPSPARVTPHPFLGFERSLPVVRRDTDREASPVTLATHPSGRLVSGFWNPMPGGVLAGYAADTGLDIAGSPRPVYALAPGTLDYSEPGHTLWTGPRDTANCVRFALDEPIPWRGHRITHVYYAHLSVLERVQTEGAEVRAHVEGGERLGISGVARGSPHLHIGLLVDGDVSQAWGTFLPEQEIREMLGGLRNRTKLPAE